MIDNKPSEGRQNSASPKVARSTAPLGCQGKVGTADRAQCFSLAISWASCSRSFSSALACGVALPERASAIHLSMVACRQRRAHKANMLPDIGRASWVAMLTCRCDGTKPQTNPSATAVHALLPAIARPDLNMLCTTHTSMRHCASYFVLQSLRSHNPHSTCGPHEPD